MQPTLTPQQMQSNFQAMKGSSPSVSNSPNPSVSWDAFDKATGARPAITQADLHNPMLSGKSNYFQSVKDAASTGGKQITEGFNQATSPNASPLDMIEGPLKSAAGAVGVLASPAAPVTNTIGAGVNAAADKISDIPAVQSFANTGIGKATERVAGDVANVSTVAGAIGGGMEGAEDLSKPNTAPQTVGPTTPVDPSSLPPRLGGPETTSATPNAPIDPAIKATVDGRVKTLNNLELSSGPLRRVSTAAQAQGIDVKNIVSNTDLLQGSVDASGKIDTLSKGGAIDQFNQFMGKYESAVSDGLKKEGISIPLDKVKIAMLDTVKNSKVAGASKTRLINLVNDELSGLQHDANPNGTISLSKLQDAKISTTNGIDYTRPETKVNAKTIASVYRTLIEQNSKLPVKSINAELSKYYNVSDYLESLNGKTVSGGKLGKYFAQTIGAVAGSHFGPLGTIIGSELGGLVKGTMLESTFGGVTGGELKATPLMEKTIQENKAPPLQLPEPQANNFGNRTTAQMTNTANSSNPIKGGLSNTQGGFAKNPIVVLFNKFHPDDQSFLNDFASKVGNKDPIPQSLLVRAQETLQHYGYNAPSSKTKLADVIRTASNSADQRSMNEELDSHRS